MNRLLIWFVPLFVLLTVSVVYSQPVITPPIINSAGDPTGAVLPSYNDAYANWVNTGLQKIGGIPTRSTQCGSTISPTGITNPPQTNDDTDKINAAISSCSPNEVVLLGTGTFVIDQTETIVIQNGVTLRGSGSCTNGSTPYCPTFLHWYTGVLPWTGGQCGIGPIAAAASWTTSNSTITMSQDNTNSLVTSGMTVYDMTVNASIGTVSSWSSSSTTLTLTGNASKASTGSTDSLVFYTASNCNNGPGGVVFWSPGAGNRFDFGLGGHLGHCGLIASAIGCGTQLDADAVKGQSTIQVHTTTGFSVGQWVLIDEATGAKYQSDPVGPNLYGNVWAAPDTFNTSGEPATGRVQWAKFVSCTGANPFCDTSGFPYNAPGTIQSQYDRPTSEIHLITAVANNSNCPGPACTITFDDPLMIAYRVSGMTTFTGSISNGSGSAGTVLATTGDNCTVAAGQIVDDATHTIKDGTYITAIGSCSGGVGSYTVNNSQLVASETIVGGAHQAHLYWPTNSSGTPISFLTNAGIENLTIDRPQSGGINFIFCAYCWVHNVEVVNWGGGEGASGGAINFNESARVQVDFSYANNCANSVNSGAEYPIGMQNSATEIGLWNNIIRQCGKGMVGKAGGGNVVAYNYQDMTMYDAFSAIGDWDVDLGINGSHWVGTHHYLFEGNWGTNLDGDDTHGNSVYHTFFRNWGTALRSDFTDPSIPATVSDKTHTGGSWTSQGGSGWSCPTGVASCVTNGTGPLRGAGPMLHVYWYAFSGNVLGTSGITTAANNWLYQGSEHTNIAMWMSGWNSDAANVTKTDPNLDGTNTPQFLFKHGNYDYVTAGIADWATGYSHALPNSFYLKSTPSFFGAGASCTYTWPWIDSTSGTPIKSNSCSGSGLPAKARYDAGTPFVQP